MVKIVIFSRIFEGFLCISRYLGWSVKKKIKENDDTNRTKHMVYQNRFSGLTNSYKTSDLPLVQNKTYSSNFRKFVRTFLVKMSKKLENTLFCESHRRFNVAVLFKNDYREGNKARIQIK